MLWVVGILALSLLIILHEFGHFVTAKIGGMHVDRFSVLGIGPVVLRLFEYKGTEFVISAIPFGAYVHIVGMESEETAEGDGDEPPLPTAPPGYRNFRDSPLWARVFAIFGGPLANYATAMLIMIGIFGLVGMKMPSSVSIRGFKSESPAEAAGLKIGDEFVQVADTDVRGERPDQKLIAATGEHLGETVDITVLREGETLIVPVTLNEYAPALSTDLEAKGDWAAVSPGTAIVEGAKWPYAQTAFQLKGLWAMVTGKSEGKVGGPVAIARALKTSAERGAVDLLVLTALISTVLGMFNLLPLPALDGGRLVFLFYEVIARRPANKQLEERIHMVGMLALLGFIAYVTVGDVQGDTTPRWKKAVSDVKADIIEAQQREERVRPPAQPDQAD